MIAIALGSNQGDRRAHLARVVRRLADTFGPLVQSTIHETAPEGVSVPQGPFLNMAVVAHTSLSAPETIERLLAIESEGGRERPFPTAPRTIDLDLVLHGDSVVSTPNATVPHPRFRDRRFVLEPLAEIARELHDPVTGLTVAALLERCQPPRHA